MGLLFDIHPHDTITASTSLGLFVKKKIQIFINHLSFRLDKDEFFYSRGDRIITWATKICGGPSILIELFEMQITSVLDNLDIPLPKDRELQDQIISASAVSFFFL